MSSDLDPQLPWLDALRWDEQGMLPAIAQDAESGRVLMFAYVNRESLQLTLQTGNATYWSRSRNRLWKKGEESGHFQRIREIRTDCDGDVILFLIEQEGGIACHTGRQSCFFNKLTGERWAPADPVLKDPHTIYSRS